jgi:hypothetical protein
MGAVASSRWMTYIRRRVRVQGILRRLAMIDQGFVEDQAGLGRVVAAVPDMAAAPGYDIAAALDESDRY